MKSLFEPNQQTEEPNLEMMPRADVPAIWDDYRTRVNSLVQTAQTLTVTDVNDTKGAKLAKTTRLALKSIRVEVEKKRKELGEEALRRSQKINSEANAIKALIEPLEERMLEQEQFAEREQARIQAELHTTRTNEISQYLVALPASINLGTLSAAEYSAMLNDAKDAAEFRAEQERLNRIEEDRIAHEQEIENEKLRVENERLKKISDEQEAIVAAKQRQIEDEREQARAAFAAQQAANGQALEAERQKARQKQAEINAEAARVKAIADQAEDDRVAAERAALAAPDKAKLLAFAELIYRTEVPTLNNAAVRDSICEQVKNFATWIAGQSESL